MADPLILSADDVRDSCHWYWRLTDAEGSFLADHTVDLDAAVWQYQAFVDLAGYLRQYVAPDKREADEARVLKQFGAWLGEQVLGPVAEQLVDAAPVTVRVVIPGDSEAAAGLFYRPLELAHGRGQPLALQGVSLVFERTDGATPVKKQPVDKALRMLAVFSLPTGARALNLRQERHALKQLIRTLAANEGLAIELRVLQYGVTREALQTMLEEGAGWDVVHFSGHGLAAKLVLEQPDGRPAEITTEALLQLLHPTRKRLKWVTLSASLSAAETVTETLHWLGIEPTRDSAAEDVAAEAGRPLPALAQSLVNELDCAVLAMRYPVVDSFAIELGKRLYEGVLDQDQTLPQALRLALPKAAENASPLSVATPALIGRRAVGLTLEIPKTRELDFSLSSTGLIHFPEEPPLFVGRVSLLARASQALAPRSSHTGVLFYGMAGAGKSACALELAYHYEDLQRFQGFVWYQAPEQGKEISLALLDFAQAMERQLQGLKMVHVVDRAEAFKAFLPRLTELLGRKSILLALDNLESLLRPDGQWRDPRWGQLIRALLAHRGGSRTLMTSRLRFKPEEDTGIAAKLLCLPLHALHRDEAVLLARQLPRLGALLRGEGATTSRQRAEWRKLVAETLRMVQGHPKLLELANGQAQNPETLQQHLERVQATWQQREKQLEAFFRAGESTLDEAAFLQALAGWTASITGMLTPEAGTLFQFLCGLEEADRLRRVVESNWPTVWQRLDLEGEAPELPATLAELTAAGLVAESAAGTAEAEAAGERFLIHPGVAEAGRAAAGTARQAALDAELAAFWRAEFDHSRAEETTGLGGRVIQAGRQAAPYLLRQRRWAEASALLEQVLLRDTSPETVTAVLPWLRRIAEATVATERELLDEGVLALALYKDGRWQEAEPKLWAVVEQAVARGEYRIASARVTDLINLLRDTGRVEAALEEVPQLKEYTRHAGLGPWSQLGDDAQELQLLNGLGRHEEVLEAVEALRERMQVLPATSEQEEAVIASTVRELILDTGREAARNLGRWGQALALNDEQVESKEAREAPALEVARSRFNDYYSLLQLQRYAEARALLWDGRAVFEAENQVEMLGKTFGALAGLEATLGHLEQAVAFSHTALRYIYLTENAGDCAISHFNLANYLQRSDGSPQDALAHWLAAIMIELQTGIRVLPSPIQASSDQHAAFDTAPPLVPSNFAELCEIVERVEGVRFAELFARLPTTRAASGDEALQQVLELAQTQSQPTSKPESLLTKLRCWRER